MDIPVERYLQPNKRPKKRFPTVFDSPVETEKMADKITFVEDEKEIAGGFIGLSEETKRRQGQIPDTPVATGSFDGCSFSATSQASWRSGFSALSRMADEWLRHPSQKKTAMKSERLHGQYMDLLHQLHKSWVEMNKGGRWS